MAQEKHEYSSQEATMRSLDFFNFVLKQSDLIVFYLIPIYRKTEDIDYCLKFASESFARYINHDVRSVLDQKLSIIFPVIFENGISEILQSCLGKERLEIFFERQLDFCGNLVWLESKAIKYNEGILITSRDVSKLKTTEEKLRDLNKQLEFQHTILKDAEKISRIASFRWNITKNTWDFSENAHLLFDIRSDTVHSLANGIFDILSVKKKNVLRELVNENLYDDALPEFKFSKKDTNGERRYYKLSGNFVPVREGQMMLGVIRDITQVVESEKRLRNKNEELIRSNAELDSFNHIASHDLQEPLRKIRMFISRVMDLDAKGFQEKGNNYLQKINSSAERMQELIQHLLTYSRIGKKEIQTEVVDLDRIVETIREDLHEQLLTTKTKLIYADLGIVKGIPFLIHQLFFNIITNSIKYAKKDVPPVIEIHSDVKTNINRSDPKNTVSKSSKFLEITFRDNGIGFKQEHEERIFELFQRLHQKYEYGGTGIGLAICKKIVETHKGHIFATSQPGEGAEFKILLPFVE